MKKNTSFHLLTATLLCLLTACSSIDRMQEIDNQRLAAKVSSKSAVVNAIGLPRTIERDEARGTEVWLYTGKPINTSYFVPMPVAAVPVGGGLSMVYYLDGGSKNIPSNDPIVLALVFDRSGTLIEIQNKQK